jgi:hypothetical protein
MALRAHATERILLLDLDDLRKARLARERLAAKTPPSALVFLHAEHTRVCAPSLDAPLLSSQSAAFRSAWVSRHVDHQSMSPGTRHRGARREC